MTWGTLAIHDHYFDFAVSKWTLCSIDGLPQALSELRRVLKPEGCFLFLKHGLSPEPQTARWQHRLSGFQMIFGDGCRLDRNFRELIPANGFQIEAIDEHNQKRR